MKAHWQLPTIAGISAILSLQAQAIEAPEDNSPPPAAALRQEGNTVETLAFVGIVADAIPEVLSKHLGIQAGEGIIAKAVMPDGPAFQAGVREHDIITRIGDRSVTAPEELSEIVRSKKPGETLKLGIIHQGEASELNVTLGSRSQTTVGATRDPMQQLNLHGVPENLAQRMREMIEGNLHEFDFPQAGGFGRQFGMDDRFREIRERMQEQMQQFENEQQAAPKGGGFRMQQSTTIRMLDEMGSIEISSRNGIRELTARDPKDKVLWTGPWGSDEDKAAAPEEIRKRVEHLNLESSFDQSGLKLRIQPQKQIR